MARDKALFGPAGNCDDFHAAGYKHTVQMFGWLSQHGLTAYEYQCGRGVRLSAESAAAIRAEAEKYGVEISLHAPYFISLASAEEEKRENSIRYILDSARAVNMLGGARIVVHPGGLGGRSREEATALATETLLKAQAALDAEGLSHVHICPEVMGKVNQLGTLEEVLTFCKAEERFLPCVDFGHLNSRTFGATNSREAFAAVVVSIDVASLMFTTISPAICSLLLPVSLMLRTTSPLPTMWRRNQLHALRSFVVLPTAPTRIFPSRP